jgi:hypothetical protein
MLMRVHSTKSIANEPNEGGSNVFVGFIAPGNLKGFFVEALLIQSESQRFDPVSSRLRLVVRSAWFEGPMAMVGRRRRMTLLVVRVSWELEKE